MLSEDYLGLPFAEYPDAPTKSVEAYTACQQQGGSADREDRCPNYTTLRPAAVLPAEHMGDDDPPNHPILDNALDSR
jgi:hypothetical protein